MKISIISSKDNYQLAKKLLDPEIRYHLVREFSDESPYPRTLIKRKLLVSDYIFVIVDEKFDGNSYLTYSSNLASIVAREEPSITLVPIILNNAQIPEYLKDRIYIPCDTSSPESIEAVRILISNNFILRNRDCSPHTKTRTNTTKNTALIALTIAIELFAVLFAIILPEIYDVNYFYKDPVTLIGILTILMATVVLFYSYLLITKRRRSEETYYEIESYSKRLKTAMVTEVIDSNGDPGEDKTEVDALGRMLINLEDIKEFYTWSQKQAKAAFYLAICMCLLGFLLMSTSVILLMVFKSSIQASLLPTIGGVVTELIAGTALIVYKNSLLQLNHYHKALHEDERFLSSVNLINKFSSPEAQDEMLKEIIRSEIQMNLSNLDIVPNDADRMT